MKRILVPIDFSKQAECAMKTAARIARNSGAEIFLLHMLDLPMNETDVSTRGNASNPAKILYLQRIHQKIEEIKKSKFLQGIKVSEEIRFHKTFSGIIDYSSELNTDLIVMGSQGATGLKEMLLSVEVTLLILMPLGTLAI